MGKNQASRLDPLSRNALRIFIFCFRFGEQLALDLKMWLPLPSAPGSLPLGISMSVRNVGKPWDTTFPCEDLPQDPWVHLQDRHPAEHRRQEQALFH